MVYFYFDVAFQRHYIRSLHAITECVFAWIAKLNVHRKISRDIMCVYKSNIATYRMV